MVSLTENEKVGEQRAEKKNHGNLVVLGLMVAVIVASCAFSCISYFDGKSIQEESKQLTLTMDELNKKSEETDLAYQDLDQQVKDADTKISELKEQLEDLQVQCEDVQSKIDKLKEAKAMEYPVTMGAYKTTFATGGGRGENIRLSTETMNNVVILPGETVSFNTITGPKTKARGYKTATVIVNGKYTDGIGGGVCQTSSTLFNASLLANLEITERHNHGLRSSYVPAGRDATVSDGYLDLKLKNPYDFPVKIRASVSGGVCSFAILGPNEASAPQVDLIVSSKDGKTYTLKRTVNGTVNYTTKSTYRN